MNIKVSRRHRQSGSEPYRYNNKIYIFIDNESVMDNLMQRRSRPWMYYKKEIIPAVMKWLEENENQVFMDIKSKHVSWRQRCGCSCPCSPGFVLGSSGSIDVFVTI